MNRFIAYFDYLGYKQFIENNDFKETCRIMGFNYRDMEHALGQGKRADTPLGKIADLAGSQIKCINFSDTVIFFTVDTSDSSLVEILKVSYLFNWKSIIYTFPVRGSLTYGEMKYVDHQRGEGEYGKVFNINSVFGKGLVNAHYKAEAQEWAGTVIDSSFTSEIEKRGYNLQEFLFPYAKKFKVPYSKKIVEYIEDEYVLKIVEEQLDEKTFKNVSQRIRENFAQYNKSIADDRVQQKISNTLQFLESYYVKTK